MLFHFVLSHLSAVHYHFNLIMIPSHYCSRFGSLGLFMYMSSPKLQC